MDETGYDRRCRTFWSGGHMCMLAQGHAGEHNCASACCPSLHFVAACWGPDAGASAFGVLPRGASPELPFRNLQRRPA